MAIEDRNRRLLVLDVDNTLLHTPVYDPTTSLLAGLPQSKSSFYDSLPEGGIEIERNSPLKVYPRPHLQEFLSNVQALGYDLALFSTATEAYIHSVLPACEVQLDRFVEVIGKETLRPCGGGKIKDVSQFVDLGYNLKDIVVVDDSRDIHVHPDAVISISPFYVTNKYWAEDSELISVIEKLKYIGRRSLVELREQYWHETTREEHIRQLAVAAFNNQSHKPLPFRPEVFKKVLVDVDHVPDELPPIDLSIDRFLIYKDRKLVGGAEKKDNTLHIINFFPNEWNQFLSDINIVPLNKNTINSFLWSSKRVELQEMCQFLGYNVSVDDPFTLAAVTLQLIDFQGLHILALQEDSLNETPSLFDL
ncbi:HAD family hydrolase [Gilvimarinus algae]|uniref:HAD family hydrolase n=1 Tax=Gilvimarinus algae TaxID=3058037 RepID=A0ABT8TA75_9GAMM|nr:HAD family hydrolase [Gilvimarinus sp. SDUM040014]MDO3380898.1 HAD family hydrolase [Gilvimarinus sp. SDUM040014]